MFDLDLLYKDLEQYGHDPHTHKYLGVTHLAYVLGQVVTTAPDGTEKVTFSENTIDPVVADQYQRGLYYCGLRVNPDTKYDVEFREERWDCMLQMALTASVMGHFAEAEKWYLECHAFSPHVPRCMYSLTALFAQSNNNDKAFRYLKVRKEGREGGREGGQFSN